MTEHRASGRDPGAFAPLFRGRARTEAWVLSDQYALHAVMTRRGIVRAAALTLLDAAGGGTKAWRRIVSGGIRASATRGCDLALSREGDAYRLVGRADRFRGDEPLLLDLRLTGQPADGRVGVMLAQGRAEIGGEEYLFAPAHSFALLQEGKEAGCGRGLVAAGRLEGVPAGLMMGNESVLLIGSRVWNLGEAVWRLPGGNGGPWRLTAGDGRAELTFEPRTQQQTEQRAPLRRKNAETQVFGHVSGVIRLENGRHITLRRMAGAARLRSLDGP